MSQSKEQIAIKNKEWYLKNRDKVLAYKKEYRKKNRELLITKAKKYNKDRLLKDSSFRILFSLRSRLRKVLKRNKKSKHTIDLIGCSAEFLKSYLESKFKVGMSWNNYGRDGWHIDHIIPCCSFDLSKSEEQSKCFHYTNLQPLWAEENLQKNRS